jgi:hypothetical protein
MILDFHGDSNATAKPAPPWVRTTQRPEDVPAATAPMPVTNAIASATNNARFVRLGRGDLTAVDRAAMETMGVRILDVSPGLLYPPSMSLGRRYIIVINRPQDLEVPGRTQ